MSHSRRRHRLAAALVVAATGVVSTGVTLPAVAAETDVLYVIQGPTCSDAGPGTVEHPFCTVQEGADAAQPGQTVRVYGTTLEEQVTPHHSGAPGKPIVIQGEPGVMPRPQIGVPAGKAGPDTSHAFLLDHVHDVTVRGFYLSNTAAEAVLVKDSAGITLDSNEIMYAGQGSDSWVHTPTVPRGAASVRVTGASDGVVVSRNLVEGGAGDGLVVDPGVAGAVLTTNAVTNGLGAGVRVTDAPGTVVTGNTVLREALPGVVVAGASDHATVENNIIADTASTAPAGADPVSLSVSAGSVAGTKADYNTLLPYAGGTAYSWGGNAYQQPDFFSAATGQGGHDLRELPPFALSRSLNASVVPDRATGSTDSADASAPGELSTDLYGRPRVDDPHAANGANGFHDRGAAELEAYSRLDVASDIYQGPTPLTVTVTATAKQNWPDTTTYTYDFGDGSTPLVTKDTKAQHTYQAVGTYTPTVTATGTGDGATITTKSPYPVTVKAPGDLVPDLRITPAERRDGQGPLSYAFDLSRSTSPWPVSGYQVDFGDGAELPGGWDLPTSPVLHNYRVPGDYTVTLTMWDRGGRRATVKQVVHAAYGKLGFTPITPTRALDTRITGIGGYPRLGPGAAVTVSLPRLPGNLNGDAVVLNVTAVNPSQAGYLKVYPTDGDRPATSNVNFKAGQTVPNLVTVPTGPGNTVTIENFAGTTDVVVDVMGYYQLGSGSRFDAVAPARLLDTRKSAAVGPDASTSIQVRGAAGVPADATAVVLNLTSTGSDAGGFLTAYPSGTTRPGTSNLNFAAGQTVANQVVVPIGEDGKVSVYNRFGHTHVVADVFGYYGASGTSLFTPVVPTRLVDTRKQTALGQGGTLKVNTGVPAGATGAVLNVTSTASTAGGYLTVWADGATKPGTSNVNFPAGGTVPNHVTTPLGTNGAFDVYNFAGSTQVVADLFGYFSK
ncbi:PKD domain-containing protein [Kitasatospora sp. NPDC002227]|uniref:PKD domain-containing protein n=1 Tax=Kitasatospora sp. NPDC002227 TaxID=3154773 RepID=UPI0033306F72